MTIVNDATILSVPLETSIMTPESSIRCQLCYMQTTDVTQDDCHLILSYFMTVHWSPLVQSYPPNSPSRCQQQHLDLNPPTGNDLAYLKQLIFHQQLVSFSWQPPSWMDPLKQNLIALTSSKPQRSHWTKTFFAILFCFAEWKFTDKFWCQLCFKFWCENN